MCGIDAVNKIKVFTFLLFSYFQAQKFLLNKDMS